MWLEIGSDLSYSDILGAAHHALAGVTIFVRWRTDPSLLRDEGSRW